MSGRIRGSSVHERRLLGAGWEFAPGAVASDAGAPDSEAVGTAAAPACGWLSITVPGTVAAGLRAVGSWSLDAPARRFDAEEWWFRLRFQAAAALPDERVVLGFDGLATLAEVWLNGSHLITSSNMFIEHRLDVGALLNGSNEVLVRCRALDEALQRRRPRPRWRTPMVAQQQLRFMRASLLGRTPGWSPAAVAVGPWRPVWLERRRCCEAHDLRLKTRVVERRGARARGELSVSCRLTLLGGATLDSACLVLQRDAEQWTSSLNYDATSGRLTGTLDLADAALWWPHTHGSPTCYRVALRVDVALPGTERGNAVEVDLGGVGFRELGLDRAGGDFALSVNGRRVFCRGACWTPLDVVSLQSAPDALRGALLAVRDAGMNMLRVSGTMVYESTDFLDVCDELGILVWHDFMFANMDYPSSDAGFRDSVLLEVRQQLARLQARPALAMLCGNSEGAQQAAMSGAPRECWAPALFEVDIAALAHDFCEAVPYTPSSAHGGAFPHQPAVGVTSYYGVGAYRLPLNDARRSALRFASECLAFANVPENETLELLADGQALRCHHPRWKERVPRDQGAGWDFDDVRDHYVAAQGHDPLELRYADHDRYLRVGRCTSGEVMAACFAEWRRPGSSCRGALVWFLQDLWPGAGWGLIDATGLPKAPYYYLKRVLQPLALFVADEGSNGLIIHLVNERPEPRAVCLQLRLYRRSEAVGLPVERRFTLAAASTLDIPATDLFEGFVDLSYAFRFGPASFDVLNVRLTPQDSEAVLAEAFHFPLGQPRGVEAHNGLAAQARGVGDGTFELQIQTTRFAQAVHMDVPGFFADDQYFHMIPHSTRRMHLKPRASARTAGLPEGAIHCLNSATVGRIAFTP